MRGQEKIIFEKKGELSVYQNYGYYSPVQQPMNQQTIPNYTQPNYLRTAQSQNGLKGRLVSSLEEARATSIDFDGSIFYFPDLANKRIYTKQINMDGTATLNMYELKETPIMNENPQTTQSINNFITRDEFEQVIGQIQQKLSKEVAQVQPNIPKKEVVNF